MTGTVARRAIGVVSTLLLTSLLVFVGLALAPGDPVDTLAGGRELGPEARAALEERYGLDRPLPERYAQWLTGAVRGDLGESYIFREQSVTSLMAARIGTTLLLVLMAALLIVAIGVLTGVIVAIRGGRLGLAMTSAASVGLAIPSFVAAVVLVGVFGVGLGWFPVFGSGEGIADRLWHLTLPAIALAIANIAFVARITETAVQREAHADHVVTAQARGLPARHIVRRHVLRNAAPPIVTSVGLVTAYLVVGAAIVETAFGLDGLGSLLVDAVARRDYPVVQAISVFVVVVFLLINLIVDLLYVRLDPRMSS